jgi:glutamate/tyrosine decarboxylase-like PLP-dependent enzyme
MDGAVSLSGPYVVAQPGAALNDGAAASVGVAAAAPALFPSDGDRLRIDDWLTDALAAAHVKVRMGPVNPTHDRSDIEASLAAFDFQEPRNLDEVLAWTIDRMVHGLVHVDHPRYFGLFNPAPTFPAQCADRIAACFNPQLATATTSPFAVELEAHVIRTLARRAGLPPQAAGHFTAGGSEANYTAMICALTHADPEFARQGARAFRGAPVFYVSAESHLAWLKIAHQAGIGRDAIRLVRTDGTGRMDAAALETLVTADQAAGHVPVMIAATAGTTGGGMIDPLAACGDIARRHGLWYHVDAAWGGAVLVSDRLRGLLAGIESADSITIDAHKWLATTMGCGMFITAHQPVMAAAFQAVMSCMPSNEPSRDPYVTTAQWSRRFLGLRLFLGLAAAGWDGYARHVERSIAVAADIRNRLVAHGWTCVNQSPMAVVCVVPPDGAPEPRIIARTVVDSGVAWIAAADFEGRPVIRVCVTHGESSEQDVAALVGALQGAI